VLLYKYFSIAALALNTIVDMEGGTFDNNELPRFSFGVIADLHYMEAEDGWNFDGSRRRRYRRSLDMLEQACEGFCGLGTRFNVLLGDVLDGAAHKLGVHAQAVDAVLALTLESNGGGKIEHNNDRLNSGSDESSHVGRQQGTWYAVVGNHEHYNFDRHEIHRRFIPQDDRNKSNRRLYYSFFPLDGYRCIVLDSFDVSTMGGSTPELVKCAEELIRSRNHNCATGNPLWFENLSEEFHRYIPCNGGLGEDQVAWLRGELDAAIASNEKCIIFSHIPLFMAATTPANVVWNCEEVLALLHSTPVGTVLACIAGHDHDGGDAVDAHGIHHLVPHAPIECEENEVTYGAIHVYESHMYVQWFGRTPKKQWPDILLLH
jgi:manganese-dependent ADP-ribose/CDP-alcohol diphosphatase